jgi:hypothetical protein
MNKITPTHPEALQARFALRVTARLNELVTTPDIDERLRFAREQALERARAVRRSVAAPAVVSAGGGLLSLGASWATRIASAVLPVALLLAGLTLIRERNTEVQIEAAAEIDAALLADDLPPDAYDDPGFAAFLKRPLEPTPPPLD